MPRRHDRCDERCSGTHVLLESGKFAYAECGSRQHEHSPTDIPPSKGEVKFYGVVNIETFPSWNDFDSKTELSVPDGRPVLVLRVVGRPWHLITHVNSTVPMGVFCYDVYEFLVEGHVRQGLRCWLRDTQYPLALEDA